MITYKGDRFVKGKEFIYEGNKIQFKTKSKKGYVFESDNSVITLNESIARSLEEVRRCKKKD